MSIEQTKQVSVVGVRSSNALRQNLNRARKAAAGTRRNRTNQKNETISRRRKKISLHASVSNQPPPTTCNGVGINSSGGTRKRKKHRKRIRSIDTLNKVSSSRNNIPGHTLTQNKTAKKGILRKRTHATTVRNPKRRVKWRDQETGTSLVSYSDGASGGVLRESPLFRDQPPLSLTMNKTMKRRNERDATMSPLQDTNIVVQWKVHEEGANDVLRDVEDIGSLEEASERLKERGVELNKKAPEDLIRKLVILTDEVPVRVTG